MPGDLQPDELVVASLRTRRRRRRQRLELPIGVIIPPTTTTSNRRLLEIQLTLASRFNQESMIEGTSFRFIAALLHLLCLI